MSAPRRTSPPTTPTKSLDPTLSAENPTTRTLNPALRTLLTTPATPNIPITPANPPTTPRNTTTASARRLINPNTTPPNSLHATRLIHLSALSTPRHSPRLCIDCRRESQDLRCFSCRLATEVPGTPTQAKGAASATGTMGGLGSMGNAGEMMTPMQTLEEARREFMRDGISTAGRRRCAVERLGELRIQDVDDEQEGDDAEMN